MADLGVNSRSLKSNSITLCLASIPSLYSLKPNSYFLSVKKYLLSKPSDNCYFLKRQLASTQIHTQSSVALVCNKPWLHSHSCNHLLKQPISTLNVTSIGVNLQIQATDEPGHSYRLLQKGIQSQVCF